MYKMIYNFNKRLTEQLQNAKIQTRFHASHGVWLCFYLSLCLPQARSIVLIPSISFLISPPLINISTLRSLIDSIVHIAVVYLTIGFNTKYDAINTTIFSILFPYCLIFALKTLPKSFTLGEANIVVQSIMIFLLNTFYNIFYTILNIPINNYDVITIILQMGILFVLLVVWTLYKLSLNNVSKTSKDKKLTTHKVTFKIFLLVTITYISLLLISLHILLRQSSIIWILSFLIQHSKRLWLLAFWSMLSLLGVAAVFGQIFSGSKASTSQRKIFHILCTAVYLSGYMWDIHLTYLASGIAFASLIALETVRKLDMGDFSVILNEGFTLFADEKDNDVSLTPLYLLTGLSLPLAFCPVSNLTLLPCLAGVLSIGIGDTFASYIGSKYGRMKWPGSPKCIEGTLANSISQLLTVALLMYFGFIDFTQFKIFISILAILLNSIEEALTDQVDNLSLPFITYFVLQFAS